MKHFFFFTALQLLLLVWILPCTAKVVDRIVATVNGEVITLFDVNARLKPAMKRLKDKKLSPAQQNALVNMQTHLINSMVDDILLKQEAQRLEITIDNEEVENQIETIKKNNNLSEEAFLGQLDSEETTREEFAENIRLSLLRQRLLGVMVRRKITVTDEEIEAYKTTAAEQVEFSPRGSRQITLALIVLSKKRSAGDLRHRILSGELSFEKAARRFSTGPGAANGGVLGTFAWKDLARQWQQVLEPLRAGQISQPFMLQKGPALLKLIAFKGGTRIAKDESQEDIRKKLFEQKMQQEFTTYMDTLKASAVIDIKL